MNLSLTELCVDKELMKKAAAVFDRYGLSIDEAVNIFLERSVVAGKLPFATTADDLEPDLTDAEIASDDEVLAISKSLTARNDRVYEELAK